MVEDFDAWYAVTRPTMASALTAWCGDPSLAADALDEAFVRAIERWDRVRSMDQPAGWVWRTATNVARRRMRRHGLEGRALRRHSAGRAAATRELSGDDVDLRRALLTLTERQRTAIVLHYIADLPVSEVAVLMGIATGTVSATLHQSRTLLAARLDVVDLAPTGLEPPPPAAPAPRTDGASP
jgi:RNA polymerase sigma-70 factor (ECF subfamily)